MNDLTIKVYNPQNLPFSKNQSPSDVFGRKISIEFCDTGIESIDSSVKNILITNNENDVRKAVERKYQRIVYFGNPDKIRDTESKMPIEIWPEQEAEKARNARLFELVKAIKDADDAWIYGHFLNEMIDSMPELVWFKTKIGAHMLVNKSFADTVRKTKEDIRGKGHYYIWDITPEEYSHGDFVCNESEDEVMQKNRTCVFDEPVLTKDGMKHLMTYKSPLHNEDGSIWGTVGVAHDMTNFSNMGIEMNYIFKSMPMPIVVCDKDMKSLLLNAEFKKEFGISEDELGKFNYLSWFEKKFSESSTEERNRLKENNTRKYKLSCNTEQGLNFYKVTEQAILDYFGNRTGYYCIFQNISQEEKFERKLIKISNTDELTGIYNRRFLMKKMYENAKRPMYFIFMDLDNFKSINDNLGHSKGDEVLKQTALEMKNIFEGGIPARFGGDEFMIVFEENFSEEKIEEMLNRFKQRFAKNVESFHLNVGVSFGKVKYTPGIENIDVLLNKCDDLMYRQKDEHHRHFREAGRK